MIRRFPHPSARWLAPLFAAAGLLASHPVAEGAVARPDQAFIDAGSAAAQEAAERHRATAHSTDGAFAALRELVDLRDAALVDLDRSLPLTTFNGIETQDRYDDAVLRALGPLVHAGVAAEGEPPNQEDAVYFAVLLGDLPPLNDSPVAFMILEYAHFAIQTVDALESDPAISPESARKLGLRLVDAALLKYEESHGDPLSVSFADAFRQSSVIVRLRCPTDGSTYRVSSEKNKLNADGGMSRVFNLKSNGTYEDLVLEFPLRYVSRLQQASERQNLKEKPKRLQPSRGLDP